MADESDINSKVQVMPLRSGSVTTLDGARVLSVGGEQAPMGPAPMSANGYPVVMPQPPVIVVIDRKGEEKPKKGYSDVFKRP